MPRWSVAVGWILLAVPLLLSAQSQPSTPASPPGKAAKFTTTTELVLVPAVVTQAGKHVSGLHREDFEVYEDKARKDITVFEEVKASAVPLHRPAAAPQFFSNVATTDAVPRRLKIIVIDEINTRFLDQTRARREIIQYLSNAVTTDELTELLRFTPSGIEVIHDFSSDPAILVAALKNVRGRLAMTESGTGSVPPLLTADPRGNLADVSEMRVLEMRINRFLDSQTQPSPTVQTFAVERTLDAFEAIASACVGLPGRKSLIWVSAGFPFMLSDTSVLSPRVMQSKHVNQRLERILDSLNAANIAVYPVDPSGLRELPGTGVLAKSTGRGWRAPVRRKRKPKHTASRCKRWKRWRT